jgi:phospholipase/carboxylesterase
MLAACATTCDGQSVKGRSGPATLKSRPQPDTKHQLKPGMHKLPNPGGREALLFVPTAVETEARLPLAISLHGANGTAERGMRILESLAAERGFAVLAPASTGYTWDVIASGYGPDIKLIDGYLSHVFGQLAIRPDAVAVSGFSDGASYALSLGVANGTLFPHVLAFSPGFMSPPNKEGEPKIFISHGTQDQVLPIEVCSRRIVANLKRAGYAVTYKEFDGPHRATDEMKSEAIRFWLDRG